MKSTLFKLGTLFLVLCSFACSKDDSVSTPEPDSNPIENSNPNPNPDPEPDPDPILQNDIPKVDDAIAAFLKKYAVPGAAIAVSVNEKMVYAKGFGFSNMEKGTPTKADDIFRIASISKTFTATAIMKLVDQGQLSLADKVFGINGILGTDFGSAELTDNELDITVDHLLIHGSGGWGTVSGDPIDRYPELSSDEFIEYVLNNWDLSNVPGESYEYSNTGYWLLARIIEKVSGQSYEDFVRSVVAPTGISTFKVTNFRREDREPNEVEYYGTDQDMQYIYTIASRRDGDAGVVISAPDVLRLMCGIDGQNARPDIISASSQNAMAQPSEISNLGRGFGTWQEQNLLYFTGSLPGTRTWFYMDANGRSAVILLNYRRFDNADFDNDLNTLLYNIVKDGTIPWQTDLDQF